MMNEENVDSPLLLEAGQSESRVEKLVREIEELQGQVKELLEFAEKTYSGRKEGRKKVN